MLQYFPYFFDFVILHFEFNYRLMVGHRFSLVGNGGEPHYLVLYEFESERDLDAWQRSQSVGERVDEYWERWGVRNLRRAYHQIWRLDRGNSVGSRTVFR